MDFSIKIKPSRLTVALLSSTLFGVTPAYADLTVNADNPSGPVYTADTVVNKIAITGVDDVTIEPTGHITSNTTTVTINSNNNLTLEPDNVSVSPPGLTTNGNDSTVIVNAFGTGAKITVGSGSGILHQVGGGQALTVIDAGNVVVENSGSITTETLGAAVIFQNTNNILLTNKSGGIISGEVEDGLRLNYGVTGIINNEAGALIEAQGTGPNQIGLEFAVGSPSVEINNAGTIQAASKAEDAGAIYLYSGTPTAVINNLEGGQILAPFTHAINSRINGAAISTNWTINNAGLIQAGKHGIHFLKPNTGNFTNSSTGVITAATSDPGTGVLIAGTYTGNILNDGTIQSTANANGGPALHINANMVGNVTNNGSLISNNGSTLSLGPGGVGLTGDIINTGLISQLGTGAAPQHAVSFVDPISGKFDNQGTIQSTFAGLPAVWISFPVAGGVFNSGNITGVLGNDAVNILSASNYTQTGGTVTGTVRLTGAGITNTFTGGSILGNLVVPVNSTVNIENTNVTGLIIGDDATTPLNVTGNLTNSGGITGFKTIDVKAGTFTANASITTAPVAGSDLTVRDGATLDLNSTYTQTAGGSGTITIESPTGTLNVNDNGTIANPGAITLVNNGTMRLSDTSTVSVTSITKDATAGNFEILISDHTQLGDITIAAPSDVTGDTFTPILTGKGFIQTGVAFPVITGAAITGSGGAGITIAPTNSQTISFVNFNGADTTDVSLLAIRAPFQGFTNTENGSSVATTLDGLVNDPNLNPDIKLAIAAMDILPTKAEITEAMESLAPDSSGGLVEMSQNLHNKSLHTVEGRLDQARNLKDFVQAAQSGDDPYYGMGAWGRVFASYSSQKNMDRFVGYNATGIGFVTGIDKSFTPEFMAGGAFSYSGADVEGRGDAGNELDIRSLQLIGYSTFNIDAWYVDAFISAALNNYKQTRQIGVGTVTRVAKANYKAWQYTGKLEAGYNLANGKYRIVPIVGAQYSMLDIDGYTESTAGGLSLAVMPQNVPEAIGTIGIRFASVNEYVEATYVPEFRILAHYDFLRNNLDTTSNFVANGGIQFQTISAKPDPITVNFGTALTAYTQKLIFSVNYDLELRSQYIGHYGSFKLRFEW